MVSKDNVPSAIRWLPQEEYAKIIGQFRLQVSGIFDFLKVDEKLPVRYQYGMGDFVPGAIDEIMCLTEDFGLRLRGIDKPLSIELMRRNRRNGNGRKKT